MLYLLFASFFSFADGFDSEFYHLRYGLQTVSQKLVDDRGRGYENLYGVRNFREVLKGVLYRGGANNLYHKNKPRKNMNPLPEDGLQNLCEEGFQTAVYLYGTNYRTASPLKDCSSIRGNNRLTYLQLGYSSKYRKILEIVYHAIQDPSAGPIYVHCWNGWHASGFISALALRQFCGMSPQDAVTYWERNTDGAPDSAAKTIKRDIARFVPYPDLSLDSITRSRVCF